MNEENVLVKKSLSLLTVKNPFIDPQYVPISILKKYTVNKNTHQST
ncbi:MAG: hypothetical protein II998_03610 [Clostridia bacterium]|nr:hypothetical protein [Clostridia bacterium]